MDNSKGAQAIRKAARMHGVSVAEARREIQLAIEQGMKDPAPEAQAFWRGYILSGRNPTPEEVIVYMAGSDTRQTHEVLKV